MDVTRSTWRLLVAGLFLGGVAATAGPAAAHPPGPATEYRWATPPAWADEGQPRAQGRQVEVPPTLFDAGVADVWTPDAQGAVTITATPPVPAGARVTITPLDPAGLPPVESAGVPNGNAYRVAVATAGWEPTGVAVTLATPLPATGVVALVDGSWADLEVEPAAGRLRAKVPPEVVVLAVADSADGIGGWWHRLTHAPIRVGVLAVGVTVIALRLARARHERTPST